MKNTLHKSERLTGKEKIEHLFQNGRSITEFPFKLLWVEREFDENEVPAKFVFSVPKRRFKKANKRNTIKRFCKEAYRLNKQSLYTKLTEEGKQISAFLIYIGNEMPDYTKVSEKIIVLLKRLIQNISENKEHVEKN